MSDLKALHSEKAGPALTGQRVGKPCDHEYRWAYSMLQAERRFMERDGWQLVAETPAPVGHDILWKRPKRDCPIRRAICPTMEGIDCDAASCQGVTS